MAIVFTTIAIAMTWPLATHLGTSLAADQGDPAFNTWVLTWTAGQMLAALRGNIGALATYWHGNIFYPETLTLAYSEHLTPLAIQALPIYAATGNGLTAYNVLFISTFALSGLGRVSARTRPDRTAFGRLRRRTRVCLRAVPVRATQPPAGALELLDASGSCWGFTATSRV